MINVLLVTPNPDIPGGVSNFNKLLLKYSRARISVFILRSPGNDKGDLLKTGLFILDIIRFIFYLAIGTYQVVHLSPSLAKNAIRRDAVFCKISKIFKKKVYVHWHGWNPTNEYLLEKPYISFLHKTIFQADHIKFLSDSFRRKFVKKGFGNISSLGNTFIDDSQLDSFLIERKSNSPVNILFLSTITENKGIYLAIDVFKKLKDKYSVSMTIAGDGPELDNVKKSFVASENQEVEFLGYVSGAKKRKVFEHADIYFFPSYYEGMPTTVIEAMGAGLPIVCSSVGAIPDFFENKKMGYLIHSFLPNAYLNPIVTLINDQDLRRDIGKYNRKYVRSHFLASKSIDCIDHDYLALV